MEVFILGSGVGVLNTNRSYPGLFVNAGTELILIDPGPGSLRQLLKVGFNYSDLDAIILTQFHPDHCLDLISFLFACRYPLAPRTKDLALIGTLGLKGFYQGILETFGDSIAPVAFKLSLNETQESKIAANRAELTIKPVAHSKSSIGIRYKDAGGKVLCYSGDTGYCNNIVQLADKADLLILECSFPDEGKVEGHLTPSYAGRIAREAKAKRLILTHLYPICDGYDILSQCRKEFTGELQIASDLMKVVV